MSLEAKIEELNGNIVKLIDVMSKGGAATGGKTAEKEAGDGAGEGAGKRGRGRPSSADKAAETEKKGKAPTEDELREVFGGFMRVDDEDERESRKSFVKGVLKEYKVAKATEIPENERANAIQVIKDEQAKRDSTGGDDDDLV